jgi:hypothetical protein
VRTLVLIIVEGLKSSLQTNFIAIVRSDMILQVIATRIIWVKSFDCTIDREKTLAGVEYLSRSQPRFRGNSKFVINLYNPIVYENLCNRYPIPVHLIHLLLSAVKKLFYGCGKTSLTLSLNKRTAALCPIDLLCSMKPGISAIGKNGKAKLFSCCW